MSRIVTLNLNYLFDKHGPWERRRALITETLGRYSPDVLVLQAVKQSAGRNQAQELADDLGLSTVCFEPAATHPDGTAEGNAFASRVPMDDVAHVRLSRGEWDEDKSERIVLSARFELDGRRVRVFNSHYSWVTPRALANYDEARVFMRRYEEPPILAGDLNTPPDAELVRVRMPADGWTDVWGSLRGDEAGPTFESDAPSIRIDYLFVSPDLRDGVQGIDLLANQTPDGQVRFGDHLALMLRLR